MANEREIGWIAGLFDGEGSPTYTHSYGKRRPRLQITNTEECLIKKAQSITDDLEIDTRIQTFKELSGKIAYVLIIDNANGMLRFFELVPVQSQAKLAKWEELKPLISSLRHPNTKSRRARLKRQHPSLFPEDTNNGGKQ